MAPDKLKARIEKIKEMDVSGFGETQAKKAVIEPVLDCLEWDTYNPDEVTLEFPTTSGRVDYALCRHCDPVVLIEAKKPGESLDREDYVSQLLRYAFEKGVPLAVLTNGVEWWFYLSLEEGDWENRKFYAIDLRTQRLDSVCDRFVEFLAKENVFSNKAVENAKRVRKSREAQVKTKKALPEVWNAVVTEPNEILVDLLAEETERKCGVKPDAKQVIGFLKKIAQPSVRVDKTAPVQTPTRQAPWQQTADYQNKDPKTFTLFGETTQVQHWHEMLVSICAIMARRHADTFESKLLGFKGPKRAYFSRRKSELEQPLKIPGTDIYAMTKLGANAMVKRCEQVIWLFGYDPSDLRIETRD